MTSSSSNHAFLLLLFVAAASGALTGPPPLNGYGGDANQVSVSGLSSGGFMAVQLHVGFSKTFMGVGVVAGGPYYCAQANLMFALTECMVSPVGINIDWLIQVTKNTALTLTIDATSNMAKDKVYLYTGTNDGTVVPGVMDHLNTYYNAFVDSSGIKMISSMPSGHAFITDNYGNECTVASKAPYISNCDYNQAYEILDHIYGPGLIKPDSSMIAGGEFLEFDQTEYQPAFGTASLDDVGYVYVPTGCMSSTGCRVHVSLHGCKQGRKFLDNEYAMHTGYNEVAELNNIIVIYPQATTSLSNGNGCWDWWGYTGLDYACKLADQMKAVKAMVDRVLS
ncbi:poly(3-hydroxybutyrate) depolymerase-like [Apostichopus japonicus]|uniref:poly(3-hydroxybutyrate) depolymerase-like n=1 Tax=Stichopus japonicus TaxID=307972 RepID=UPI003AB1A046